ncbi:MAG: 2-amino-4-hydroxy-6-hydroxymethyldihydropteridine diphosphokinase [Cryomorphaceae bacterium]|nr:2-amino-4-hydroxy-6-hydroxymethyldihydropteridine diphosphokinase [Cryomorphaceae bacterium]
MEKKLIKVVLSLGSNIGERKKNLLLAYQHIENHIGKIVKFSSYYENPSQGFDSDNDFMNTCIGIETSYQCQEVLDKIHWIEHAMGRKRTKKGYEDRVIDIDIIFFGDQIIRQHGLKVPHPKYHERDFVLIPLKELDFMADPRQKFKA